MLSGEGARHEKEIAESDGTAETLHSRVDQSRGPAARLRIVSRQTALAPAYSG